MMKLLLVVAGICLMTAAAHADVTCCYDWEDCGTVLGLYGSGDPPIIAGTVMEGFGPPPPAPAPYEGVWCLRLEDNSPSGTPQAFVGWITGLQDGDSVTASFWRYDVTPGASPSCRIWGHYSDDADPTAYYGSASGNSDYGPGLGWDEASFTWHIALPVDATALTVECRTYSNPGDVVWIDYICITFPSRADVCCHFPEAGPSATRSTSWGRIKTLYR